jgi:hypothetical protein
MFEQKSGSGGRCDGQAGTFVAATEERRVYPLEEDEEEIIRLPRRGRCGRAAAGSAALSLRCAASTSANVYTGYA